ncbi:hypothetical protein RR46_09934 [Papilio xuthus]|uniref:Uncharacterized protein n=1 Tax=Papilio xuthus TaxID=66420 RepID=A0A194QH10_PAPXU|nr:hypothetical protein RR46_09934 [Papilio xuthus]
MAVFSDISCTRTLTTPPPRNASSSTTGFILLDQMYID